MDFIEGLTKGIARMCAKIFLNKEEKTDVTINFEQLGPTDMFKMMLKSYYGKGDYNRAENLIFNELQHNNSPEVYELAVDFYNSLLSKSDETLLKNNFPRKEVYQGLEDIKKFNIKPNNINNTIL